MSNKEDILTGFRPENFRRKDLEHCWLFPSRVYWYQLDAYAAWLENTVSELRAKCARAGSLFYQQDAKEWGRQWNDLQRKLGEKNAEIITVTAEKDAEIKRLQREIEYLQEQLEAYESAEIPKDQRKRNSQTGRFVSDLPKDEKIWKAWDMQRKGYNYAQIARELCVSTDTVKRYIRAYQANKSYDDDPTDGIRQPWE